MSQAIAIKRGGGFNFLWIILIIAMLFTGGVVIMQMTPKALATCQFVMPKCDLPATTVMEDGATGATAVYCDEHAAKMAGWGWKVKGPVPD